MKEVSITILYMDYVPWSPFAGWSKSLSTSVKHYSIDNPNLRLYCC